MSRPLKYASTRPPSAGNATVAAFTQVPIVPSRSKGAKDTFTSTAVSLPGLFATRAKRDAASSFVCSITSSPDR